MRFKPCWELVNCWGDYEGCRARATGRSCWHDRNGFHDCPLARATGRVWEFRRAQLDQEQALLGEARRGRQEAFEALAREFACHMERAGRRFFLAGGDREDLLQEARIGLFRAVKTYDSGYGRSLAEHAQMCIRNSVVRAVRASTRKKHQVLSRAVAYEDLHPAAVQTDPLGRVEAGLLLDSLIGFLKKNLSRFELGSLVARVSGTSVGDIGAAYQVPPKKVENALFRARQKVRYFVQRPAPREAQWRACASG